MLSTYIKSYIKFYDDTGNTQAHLRKKIIIIFWAIYRINERDLILPNLVMLFMPCMSSYKLFTEKLMV